jgi:hypothetical protein
MKSNPASIEEIKGEMNHEAAVHPNFVQFIALDDKPASPDPMSAPITVCVPLIGIPKIEEIRMKLNEDNEVPSISRSSIPGVS